MKLSELYRIYLDSTGVSTDTRKIKRGMIFFGLTGRHHDGSQFAEEALKKGAALVICTKSPYQRASKKVFVSKDPLSILQKLANYHRKQLENTQVIAISGSNGKTTTRSLCYELIKNHYATHATKGNFNNHIGMPLTILDAPVNTEILILELGANSMGEIKELCAIALPDIGLITNVGKDHLAGFGSEEGVRNANAELYDFLAENNKLAFVDAKEDYLLQMSVGVFDKIFYNQKINREFNSLECHIKDITENPTLAFTLVKKPSKAKVTTHLVGKYNIKNIMAAVTIAEYFNIPFDAIVDALRKYRPEENRSQYIQRDGFNVILDAYNANPSSVMSALDSFEGQEAPQKHLILGEMNELGAYSLQEHRDIVERLTRLKDTSVWLVGHEYSKLELPASFRHFKNVHEISAPDFEPFMQSETLMLIKGSRSVQLEKLLELLPETISD